ncbi:pentatricopeptide repeat-containing protein At4g31850, chloroplastic [Selaginella moellendorffii]|uniref:pentatricopeptide repeat-containing protein At4g31850, chloroplastic n=1 Tax=Selaginella moellendorffii TaxID=88036 RepID=UPI000D1CDECA|nr:pentatricopeptide repeat-containing protein At4g31850, chloroplastic [Selaginella moellendorffii]|eukprot:XP_024531231.1 pentatricopeptide repeat-containing protein At4g31850, chloroplastic [Selaginella moellendorffii]
MQPLKTLVAAAAMARQWLRSSAARWLPPSTAAVSPSSSLTAHQEEECGTKEVTPEPAPMAQEQGLRDPSPSLRPPCIAIHPEAPHFVEERAMELEEHCESPESSAELSLPGSIERSTQHDGSNDTIATASRVTKLVELSGGPGSAKIKRILWEKRRSRSRIIAQVLQNLDDADAAIKFFRWVASSKTGLGFKHTPHTANSLLLTLIKLGQATKAHEIFTAGLPAGCRPDRTTVSTVLYGLVDSGRLQCACEFCGEIKRAGLLPYGKVLSVLIQALCAAGDVDRAVRIGRELTVDPADFAFTYGILIHTLCKLGEISAAWSLFYELQDKGGSLDAQVYASLLYGLCNAGDLQAARALLDDMASRDFRLDAAIYNTLIAGLCKARKPRHALELVHVMAANGYDASVVTYTTLIDGLCKSGDLDAAQALLQKMADAGCAPNVVTYTALIDGLCKARRPHDAIQTVKRMLRSGCEPDLVTYNSLIHGLCMANRMDDAGLVLQELVRNGFAPNHITYSTLVIWNCRRRRLDQARGLIREMILRGSVCNLVVYIDCIFGFCEARCQSSRYECRDGDEVWGLFGVLEEMVVEGCRGGSIVFEGESLYDPISRLERVEQIAEFMFHKGCFGSDERYATIQGALTCIKRLKTPSQEECARSHSNLPDPEREYTRICPPGGLGRYFFCLGSGFMAMAMMAAAAASLHTEPTVAACASSSSSSYVAACSSSFSSNRSTHNADALIWVLNSDATRLQEALEQCSRSSLSRATVSSVLRNARDCERALTFYDWAATRGGFQHDAATTGTLVRMLAKNKRHGEAFSRLAQALDRGLRPNAGVFAALLSACVAAGDRDKVRELFKQMERAKVSVETKRVNGILHDLCSGDKIEQALELLQEMINSSVANLYTYNIVVSCLCRLKRVDEAQVLMSEMIESGRIPDVVTYNTFISGLCKAGKLDKGLEMLEEMDRGGIPPDVVTFCSIISGLCKANRIDDAFQVFKGMLERGCVPDSLTYSIMLDNLSRANRLDTVDEVLEHMVKSGHYALSATYAPLIHALIRAGDIESASWAYEQAMKAGCVMEVYTHNAFIGALCRSGKFPLAKNILLGMIESGSLPNLLSYNFVIDGLCKSGNVDDAWKLSRKMLDSGCCKPDVIFFNTLISGFCKAGRLSQAHQLLIEMKAKNICVPDVVTYNTLIDGQSKFGSLKQAKLLLQEMQAVGCKPNVVTYAALINGYAKHGMYEEAESLFDEMSAKGCFPDIITYNTVLSAFSKAGMMSKAEGVYQQLKNKTSYCSPDAITYRILIDGYCRAEDTEQGLTLLQEMTARGWSCDSYTYNVLIAKLAETEEVPSKALAVYQQMLDQDCVPSASIFNSLVRLFLRTGDVNSARSMVQEMNEKGHLVDASNLEALNKESNDAS